MTSLSLFSPLASAETPVLLRYQFQPGQALRYQVELAGETGLFAAGSSRVPVNSTVFARAAFRMVEINPDGTAVLEARAEDFRMRVMIGGKEVGRPPVATVVGQAKKFPVGPTGLPAGQNLSAGEEGPPWSLILQQIFPDLPEDPVQEGSSWTSRERILAPAGFSGAAGPTETVTRYKYLGRGSFNGRECDKISVEITPLFPEGATGKGPAQPKNRLTGTVLLAGGRLVSSQSQGSVEQEHRISSSGSGKKGLAGVTVKSSFSSRVTLIP